MYNGHPITDTMSVSDHGHPHGHGPVATPGASGHRQTDGVSDVSTAALAHDLML